MSIVLEILDDPARLAELAPEWEALATACGAGALLHGPAWSLTWLKHYGPALGATPQIVTGRYAGQLVAIAPLYLRPMRLGAGIKVRELRLIGDAGPRPPYLDILVKKGHEDAFGGAFCGWLGESHEWDVLDLMPLRDPSRARAFVAERLDASGRRVDSEEAGRTMTITLAAAGLDPAHLPPKPEGAAVYDLEGPSRARGLAVLRRLSRLEWAQAEEHSPYADNEGTHMLEDVLQTHAGSGGLRLARFELPDTGVSAVALVIDDNQRAVCVAIAVDPERKADGTKLLAAEARAAAERGLKAFDVVTAAVELEPPQLPVTVRRSLRLRAFNTTTGGAMARTYARLRRNVGAAREAPGAAAAGARAAWSRIREAASHVAGMSRLHLYRGELWTRGVKLPEGLLIEELTRERFVAMPESERQVLLERLELDEAYCVEKWTRGDLAVLATLNGRPSGIAWCARAAVLVPELGREVRPGLSECYIHDVFVSADARGRNVAPAMLEDLALKLRQRDVYKAWALIQPQNVASTRAFEKAAYASVADVIHAHMGPVDRFMLRPPDPEAKRLLGIN